FFFSSRRRHTRFSRDWSSDVCSSDLSATHLLGDAPNFVTLKNKIAKLARSQAPVYISGESGTGKELVARAIHEQGPRANEPFVRSEERRVGKESRPRWRT